MAIHQQQQGFEGGAAGQNALEIKWAQPGRTGRAALSSCGRYRWWLERQWQPQAPRLLFVGLNPSRATAERDDPTLRRLIAFAQAWGYGSLEVLNLFARISASPAVLRRSADPIGPQTDQWLQRRLGVLADAPGAAVWLGWGNGGRWRDRDQAVLRLLRQQAVPLLALGLTASGQPRHPLYAAKAAQPLRLTHSGEELRPG
ncbi:MAG: DUF1643 domain-containing protein [Vulcanococcus sp.]|uniref:DUF1643 domain-containing protein n=1 Tax=Vulcanococcus sp. CPBay_Sum15L08_68 TaxID=2806295 RepID=UPI0025F984FA|nr:DUF1643 domain-containing protein [Vulcanococcus sp. CPBay_Sum15L08_68]